MHVTDEQPSEAGCIGGPGWRLDFVRVLNLRKEMTMCCGSRRSAWRAASPSPEAATASPPVRHDPPGRPAPMSVRSAFPSVDLYYSETAEIRVRGPVTGRPYVFSGSEPVQAVDARDAAILTRNGSFRRSGAPTR